MTSRYYHRSDINIFNANKFGCYFSPRFDLKYIFLVTFKMQPIYVISNMYQLSTRTY
jgi:hypothetical protein